MSKFFTLFLLTVSFGVSAQDPLGIWNDHIPHGTIYDIAKVGDDVFCATEIGLFAYNEIDKNVTTYSKLNGLSDIGIRAIEYDAKRGQLILGYKNGNIDIFDGENITNVSDIVRSSKFVGKKRINNIEVYQDVAYISTGFGIIELDLDNFIVLNTLIIGDNAQEIEVFDVEVDEANNTIYAATEDQLRVADLDQPLIFFSFWKPVVGLEAGSYTEVEVFNNYVFTSKLSDTPDDSLFYSDNGTWQYFSQMPIGKKTDIRSNDNTLLIVDTYFANTYDDNLNLIIDLSQGAGFPPGTFQPNVAWQENNGRLIYVGNFSYSLIRSEDITNNSRITPDGPFSNSVYTISNSKNKTFISPGSIDEIWNRRFQFDGIFEYKDFEWSHYSSDDLGAGDIVAVSQDPMDENKIWANAWGTGILEIVDGKTQTLYNHLNTDGALKGALNSSDADIRTGSLTFDDNGNLWATNSLTEKPLIKKDKEGNWTSYGFGSLSSGSIAFKDILVNELGQIWMQTRLTGFVVVEFINGQAVGRGFRASVGNGNLPEDQVLSMAEDLDGEMWLGTLQGLVVCYAPQNIFNGGNFDAQPVLFEEDGVVQKLLGTEQVTAIAVDGANKKWFGTQNAGVFYTSEDGTETIYHFTKENSPLLSNGILDIEVDNETGEVFFGTSEGVVSFRNAATTGNDEFNDVFAYPNPVRPDYAGPIFIRGLATNAQVKITDVQGNIVYETVAEGGQAIWYGTDLSGERVASGVYIANMNNDDGSLAETTKILIIN
jgi:hypothetical protein